MGSGFQTVLLEPNLSQRLVNLMEEETKKQFLVLLSAFKSDPITGWTFVRDFALKMLY